MQSMVAPSWVASLACFLLGAITVLSFAPFSYWWLSFICLAGLLYFLSRADAKQSARLGFLFGLGLYIFGVFWVYISLSTYGGMPLWMGSIAVLGFAAILSAFIASYAFLSAYLSRPNTPKRWLALAIFWPVFEWLKSWVLTGFPWLDIGYTQVPSWLLAWAPIGGVYLVSLIVVVISICLCFLIRSRVVPVCAILLIAISSYFLNQVQWSQPDGSAVEIGILQGNVDLEEKWSAQHRQKVLQDYSRLGRELASLKDIDLLVMPETALPLYLHQLDQQFWRDFGLDNVALLTGVLEADFSKSADQADIYNAAVLVCDGQNQVYRKRHLVPFGEYLPLRFLFNWVLEYLQFPMSDMASWQGEQALKCGEKLNIGLSICYEDAFSGELQQYSGEATVLVNISEDAWFGDSLAPHQREQMAQMRARELSRPMIRSANSGPSTFIDERGRIVKRSAQFEVVSMSHSVQPQTGRTPFKRYGEWVVYLCLLGLLALIVHRIAARKTL